MKSLILFVLFSIFLLKICKAAPLNRDFDKSQDDNAIKNKALPNDDATNNSQTESVTKVPEIFNPSTITYSDYVNDFLDEQNNLPERRLADEHFYKKIIALAVVLVAMLGVVVKIMILKELGCNWCVIWCLL